MLNEAHKDSAIPAVLSWLLVYTLCGVKLKVIADSSDVETSLFRYYGGCEGLVSERYRIGML